jgi:serine/threonine-protein kinase
VNSGAQPAQIGKYWVKRLLGTGGMGRVFLALDPDIGREVAIKLVTLGSDPQASERFLREAQTMGRLNHPNIVTLLEFGVDQQSPFLVLEFLSGEDLSQWMLRPHTLREQVQVMLDVAQAITAAHKVGVLHRDLKPENVRVLDDGRCKLLDFGIAQSGAGQLTASGYFVGTPEFVAPEVMSGAAHSAAADIYALGLLYYTMLCGANPFRGDTVQATVARVVQLDPPPLSKRVTGVPVELEMLIHGCLAKQPEQRPASADSLVQALSTVLARVPADARVGDAPTPSDTAPYPTTPAPSKTHASAVARPPTAAAAPKSRAGWAVAAVLLLVSAVSAWWLLQPAPVPDPTSAIPATAPSEAATAVVPPTDAPPPVTGQPVDLTSTATATQPGPVGRDTTAPPVAVQPPPVPVDVAPPTVAAESVSRPQPAATPAPETADVAAKPVESKPSVVPSAQPTSSPAPAQDVPQAIAEQPPEPVPEVLTTAVTPVPVQVARVNPRVLRAGRNVTMRLEGSGLAAVSSVVINAGGVVDTRFRVGALEHSGDAALQFNLNVARGVPLGSYALVLRGADVRAEPILLEVSL